MVQQFSQDEQAYLAWVEKHPYGYVLNMHQTPQSGYLVLHKASCPSISRYLGRSKPGGFTARTFQKMTSLEEAELKKWIQTKGFSDFSNVCGMCFKHRH